MKVLLVSNYDIKGGAARATYRLHEGLQSIAVNSQILVNDKSSNDENVRLMPPKLGEKFKSLRT